ncbi:hypothetical protein HCN44_000435 [Aphidius gifuensis]|uniref:Mutator-like transposase domain-containing protein n=1 Tax=Aphidius gifuensis TaxID=684658 RepID=A0A834XNY8_APHGI|nr:hypothetical protein HCN44_000435 [Aphidius gifuensis]
MGCGTRKKIWTSPVNPEEGLEINNAAVAGTLISGMGYLTLKESLAMMNVRAMDAKTYRRRRGKLGKTIKKMAEEEWKKATLEEIAHAKANGNVTSEGIPKCTVKVDGSWPKRSFGPFSKYDSSSGCAVVVGFKTRKVIACGIRNKICGFCERNKEGKDHPDYQECTKNWGKNQPSTAMEQDIIVTCVCDSIKTEDSEKHLNLIYEKIISDGDSSVMSALNEACPYIKVNKRANQIKKDFQIKNVVNQVINNMTNRRMLKNLRSIAKAISI